MNIVLYAAAAFIGALSALIVMAEINATNKWVKYLVAFVVGILVTVGLSFLLQIIASAFAKVAS